MIERDWAVDGGSEGILNYERFCESFFELADIWTPCIDAAEYASFLLKLFRRITIKGVKKPKAQKIEKVKPKIVVKVVSKSSEVSPIRAEGLVPRHDAQEVGRKSLRRGSFILHSFQSLAAAQFPFATQGQPSPGRLLLSRSPRKTHLNSHTEFLSPWVLETLLDSAKSSGVQQAKRQSLQWW